MPHRYVLVAGVLLSVFLVAFVVAEALGVPLLTDPSPWMSGARWTVAAVGVGLLVGDVVLPVPSSAVMVAHGAVFGVVVGALLSLLGSVGSVAVAFAIGRRGSRLLRRVTSDAERARADALLRRWGALAIVVTRPVPMLAETVAILAGTSPMRWSRALGAAVAGSVPLAVVYAITGAVAATFGATSVVFLGVVAAAASLWWWERRRAPAAVRGA